MDNSSLDDEITSINAIYGPSTLVPASSSTSASTHDAQTYVLHLSSPFSFSIRLSFPTDYPSSVPTILGPETSGPKHTKKGQANALVDTVRDILMDCFRDGEPCIFDLLEELRSRADDATHSAFPTNEQGLSDAGSEISYNEGKALYNPDPTSPGESTDTHYNALIRTHHITSRKKLGKVKKLAHHALTYLLVRSNGSPGLMYAESESFEAFGAWIKEVAVLRYKDYTLVREPAEMQEAEKGAPRVFEEVESVAAFGARLGDRGQGVMDWWREAMGYTDGDG